MRTADRELTVDHEPDVVIGALRAVLQSDGAKIRPTRAAGEVVARTGSSARSWGEDVTVHVSPAGTGTHVDVHVSTRIRLTIVDYGATRGLADRLARAVADPSWATSQKSKIGTPRLPLVWRWIGVPLALLAGALTSIPSVSPRKGPLLVAAGVAVVLWTVAIVSRSLTIRRHGQQVPPWQFPLALFITLGVGFSVSDALKPRHSSLALGASADLSSLVAAFALAALIVANVQRILRRRST